MDVFEILKEDGLSFYNRENKGGQNGLIINNLPEKLIEQYEERINEFKIIITELKETIKELKGNK